jgi:glycosyltransferase involved in cell wall biosynthesis
VPRQLHVLFVDSVAKLSGGELALLRTIPALIPAISATVVLAEDGPLAPRLREIGATVIILPLDERVLSARRADVRAGGVSPRTVLVLVRHVFRLRNLIRELNPDIVHTNSLKSALYGGLAARLAHKRLVWHIRDRIADDYLPRPAVLLVRALARLLPHAVIANSRATLATIRPRDSAIIGSPVVFDSVTMQESPLRHQSDSFSSERQNDLIFGIVGRISPWKGQDVFLRAFALAFSGGPARARIIGSVMFGEDDTEAKLHQLVQNLGIGDQVEFRGFRKDVYAELRQLDVAVHASTIPEPFGQVVLEAMAVGTAVIASDEGGPAEIVTDGVDGLLVRPREPQELAAAMVRLGEDVELRHRLTTAAKITAAAYTPDRTAEGILAVYRALISATAG